LLKNKLFLSLKNILDYY